MTWKFIPSTDESRNAGDADTLSTLDWGSALWLQAKKAKFKLGNTGGTQGTFTVQVSGVNSTLVADTTLSEDDKTYASSLSLTIGPNEVSPTVYAKHTVREGATVASGNIRIHILEA